MSIELPCIVEKVGFRNDEGFAILYTSLNANSYRYKPELEQLVDKYLNKKNGYNNLTVTVTLLNKDANIEGAECIFIGDFVSHPKYGYQFKTEFFYVDVPTDEDSLKAVLMNLPNIKEARSNNILERFGFQGTIDILDNDINKLLEINGITEKRIPAIKETWDKSKELRELYLWLGEHKISPIVGKKIYDKWGKDSIKFLSENPYLLMDVKGFGFIKTDEIAHKILCKVPVRSRVLACIRHVLTENLYKESNLCLYYSILKENIITLINESSEKNRIENNIKECLVLIPVCIKENPEMFTAVKDTSEEPHKIYIYLRKIWDKEKYIADKLWHRTSLCKDKFTCDDNDLNDAEKDISQHTGKEIKLNETQKLAIKSAFENKITVITGAGGTGKSSICRGIYYLASEKGMSIRLLSPTGKAAKVLSDKSGYSASTIHRSLKMTPDDELPREKIGEDIVVIDEVSMIGVDTLFAVMNALENNLWCNIVFVGDHNQLPSVSPGNFLFDIIKSECANVIKLDKIYRQSENSYIALIANDIAKGKVTDIPENAVDIKFQELKYSDTCEEIVKDVIMKYLNDGNDINDLQFIAPMYKGDWGINKINEAIQMLMAERNGNFGSVLQKDFNKFYIGDRCIQLENNYKKNLFNGDMGIIKDLGRKVIDSSVSDEKKDFVLANFYGDDYLYVDDEIQQLKLAWVVSVHKFQGSQADNIVFFITNENQRMISKELVYSSITRAAKHINIFGNYNVFRSAPMKSVIKKRYTNFSNIIKEYRENRKILEVR
jgi:exodeoxyribonuclease V alpha subunit